MRRDNNLHYRKFKAAFHPYVNNFFFSIYSKYHSYIRHLFKHNNNNNDENVVNLVLSLSVPFKILYLINNLPALVFFSLTHFQ